MRFHVLTLFPEMIEAGLGSGIIGRALEGGIISLHTVNIRQYTAERHGKVDDYPYGGGAGMLMQAQPVYDAHRAAAGGRKVRTVYVTPQGSPFTQKKAAEFAREEVRQMRDVSIRAVSALLSGEAGRPEWLTQVAQLEQKIDDMTADFRRDQLVRMRDGTCSDEACILYSELLTDFERIGDHVLNIAQELTKAKTAL